MIGQTYENQTYYSRKASNGAMVRPGEITSVFYYHTDTPCKNGTYRYFYTDGWIVRHCGRYHPAALRAIGEKLLNKEFRAGEEAHAEWCKNRK